MHTQGSLMPMYNCLRMSSMSLPGGNNRWMQCLTWISPSPIQHEMHCDAANFVWGVKSLTTPGDSWNDYEVTLHINVKEMFAIYYSIRAFKFDVQNTHLKIYSDNSTAVSVINKMGTSRSRTCNQTAKMILEFCRIKCISDHMRSYPWSRKCGSWQGILKIL